MAKALAKIREAYQEAIEEVTRENADVALARLHHEFDLETARFAHEQEMERIDAAARYRMARLIALTFLLTVLLLLIAIKGLPGRGPEKVDVETRWEYPESQVWEREMFAQVEREIALAEQRARWYPEERRGKK